MLPHFLATCYSSTHIFNSEIRRYIFHVSRTIRYHVKTVMIYDNIVPITTDTDSRGTVPNLLSWTAWAPEFWIIQMHIFFLQSIIVKILSKPYSSGNKVQNRHESICITVGKVMTGQSSVFSFEISTWTSTGNDKQYYDVWFILIKVIFLLTIDLMFIVTNVLLIYCLYMCYPLYYIYNYT